MLAAWAAFSGHLAFAQQTSSAIAGAAPLEIRNGSAALLGHYEPQQHLRLVIGLSHPNLAAEEQFLEDLHNPASPNFMKFLSAEEWNRRFSPAAADEQAVVDWAKSQGLVVTQRYANRLLVDVDAPTATIEKAFAITINRYRSGDRAAFSNDRNPTIPAHLLGVVHSIAGLNSLQTMHPATPGMQEPAFADYAAGPARAVGGAGGTDAKAPRANSNASPALSFPPVTGGAYSPQNTYTSEAYDLDALYAVGHCCNPLGYPGLTPAESSIAIATAGTQSLSDLAGFQATYPTLASHFQQILVDGTGDCCDSEGTLDFDWATAWSNSFGAEADTAMIYLYDGADDHLGTFQDVYNQILSDGHARVFSTSWGCEEIYCHSTDQMDTDHGIFNAMIAQGWTLVAASGDQGATGGCADRNNVLYPSSDPNVVAAGGTNLELFSNGTYSHEYGWTGGPNNCTNNDGGSTGGASLYWGAPSYQTSLGGSGARTVPDVALNADWYNSPQFYYFNGSVQGSGGTSIVAPSIAGFFAQANAYLDYVSKINGGCNGAKTCTPLGNGNWYLYYFGENPNYAPHYPFYDITSGCNNNDITSKYGLTFYCAGGGYDEVTGWGSFNALQLSWAINAYRAGVSLGPVITMHGPTLNTWYKADREVTWTIADTGHAKPTGVAGFSQAWDTAIADTAMESTPGAYDGFYTGPELPGATQGHLFLSSGGQGCHTVQVRAYDNIGVSSYKTYGPVCYDTIPPVSTAFFNYDTVVAPYYTASVPVRVQATDIGPSQVSGLQSSSYNLDGAGWVLSPVVTISGVGTHKFQYRSTDNAGNVEVAKSATIVIKNPTTTALTLSPQPSAYNQPVTMTATVTSAGGDTPTGVVTFSDTTTSTVLGKGTLSGGVANLTTRAIPVGQNSLTASYAGSTNDGASNSTGVSQAVSAAASGTKLTSSLNPSSFGQTVALSAKVSSSFGGPTSGTVTFTDGSTPLGTQPVNSSTNTATLSIATLLGGKHTIVAQYNGSTNDGVSSGKLAQTVAKADTTTVLTSSLNPSTYGTAVTFIATLAAANGGKVYGSVTFRDGAAKLGAVLLTGSNLRPSFTTSSLARGSHNINAVYSGSSSNNPSNSNLIKQVVN